MGKKRVLVAYEDSRRAKTASKVAEGKLSTDQRNDLPGSAFALPSKREFPINDAEHVRAATSRLESAHNDGRVTKAEYIEAKQRIAHAAKKFGVKSEYASEETPVEVSLEEAPRKRSDRSLLVWRDTPSGNSFAHGSDGDYAAMKSAEGWSLTGPGGARLGVFATKDEAEYEGERNEQLELRNARVRHAEFEESPDPAGGYAQIQRMVAAYVTGHDLGTYVPNSAMPTGEVVGSDGVWSFYAQPPSGKAQRHTVRNSELRKYYQRSVASENSLEESPTREEWEVVVTNSPAFARGRILNTVGPGDSYVDGNKIYLTGFHDDSEAHHVASGIAHQYPGVLVTFGPRPKIAAEVVAEVKQATAKEDCGCGGKGGGQKTIVEKTEVNVIQATAAAEEQRAIAAAEERGITDVPSGSICRPFTRIERDPAKFEICMARAKEVGALDGSRKFYNLVAPEIVKRDAESFYVICIDFRGQLRDFIEVAVGQRHKVAVDIEDILAVVILSKCDGFAVAHCHPSGHASPSDADKRLTVDIKRSAKVACPNVPMVDHLIIGLRSFYSFADKKLYRM